MKRINLRVFSLALADTLDEWVLSACMVFALSAIITPLFILLGLKQGVVNNLLDRLRNDPVNREIRPRSILAQPVDDAWIQEWRANPGVEYITPSLRGLGMTMRLEREDRSAALEVKAAPSSAGDPLLLDNGATPPGERELTMTSPVAKRLRIQTGDFLVLHVSRRRSGKMEQAQARLQVAGVTDDRASTADRAWLSFQFLTDVERFLAGQGVPRLGWPGDTQVVQPRFDGALVLTPKPLSDLDLPIARVKTGFTECMDLTPEQVRGLAGFELAPDRSATLWRSNNSIFTQDNLDSLRRHLEEAGHSPEIRPWIDGLQVRLREDGDLVPLYVSPEEVNILPAPGSAALAILTGDFREEQLGDQHLWIAAGDPMAKPLAIPVAVQRSAISLTGIRAPAEFCGLLNGVRRGELVFDPTANRIVTRHQGYSDFRLYATGLEAIESIVNQLERAGVPTVSRRDEIVRIQSLERQLSTLFLLIAIVAAIAGTLSTGSSLYANVQRKKRDLAYLALIGFQKRSLVSFPAYQGVMLMGGALIVAWGAYSTFRLAADHFFRESLRAGESFCQLQPDHVLGVSVCSLAIAIGAALVGGFAVSRINPADSIRPD